MASLDSHRVRAVMACCGLLAACGEPLAGGDFQGEAEATFQVQIISDGEQFENVRAALFWASDLQDTSNFDNLEEQVNTSRAVVQGERTQLSLFGAPEEHLVQPWFDSGDRAAVGFVYAYEDSNLNGQRDADEPFAGESPQRIVLYSPETLAADDGPQAQDIEAGYSVHRTPMLCDTTIERDEGDCGVPLGERCTEDEECGDAGYCIQTLETPWPRGACAVQNNEDSTCRPSEGAFLLGPPEFGQFFIESCRHDDDCTQAGVYTCDPLVGACLPGMGPDLVLTLRSRVGAAPLCFDAERPRPMMGMMGMMGMMAP